MNVLMLIKTSGLDYDDRLRKEIGSLNLLGATVNVVAVENKNHTRHITLANDGAAKVVELKTRRLFPQAKGLAFKTFEMYLIFLIEVIRQKPTVLWVHDLELSFLILFFGLLRRSRFVKLLVWDQHELPPDNWLIGAHYRRLYSAMMNQCDWIIMANEQRRDIVKDVIGDSLLDKSIEILHNYPDQLFITEHERPLPKPILDWLDGAQYLLAQGGAAPDRHFMNVASALMQLPNLKMIVVGTFQQAQIQELDNLYSATWRDRIWFTGLVPQLDILPYIDHAYASIVLYEATSHNTRLCEPNRLYQAIARETPVITGSNPPMAEIVVPRKCGVVLVSDGCDVPDIVTATEQILRDYDIYKQHAARHRFEFIWETQQQVFLKILAPLLKAD
jgi:glycosyltransferase involved in cell wall biosynthesis